MKMENVEDIYPLSPMQQGLLFHSLYAPDAGLYVAQIGCRIGGELCVDAFKRAWQMVVDRHAILRSSFLWEGLKEPLQVVRRSVLLSWEEADWRELAEPEREARLETFLRTDSERGFELRRAPLMRLALIRLADDAYQVVWSHHHLLLDGWCTTLVFDELFALYESHRRGQELRLASRRPYRDFVAWLKGQDLGRAEAFWRETLGGFTAATPLGVDRPLDETAPATPERDDEHALLSREATTRLEALARRHQLTLNTVLQGAWALLLSRYGGEEDVVFGATVSGRPVELVGVESMLGLFINTLPVRVRVRPEQSLAAWLVALQEQQVEARQYEHSPLVDVQGWSEVPRGEPLFESILVFENYPVDEMVREKAGRTLGIDEMRMVIRNSYPLTLTVHPGMRLWLLARYDGRRFEVATIRRLLGHLSTLLEAMGSQPEARLMDLPLLTGPERHQLLREWNAPAVVPAPRPCIQELFAEQARARPDAIAAVCEDAQLSYGELERRANRLARHLVRLGMGPDMRVGICLDRSLELVVALLATLKAGGAYVPLDPENPAERLRSMLRDADARVLLTRESLRSALPRTAVAVVCLDSDWPAIDRGAVAIYPKAAAPPPSGVTPGNLAYVIYTSGSTGQPKGVAVEHAQLAGYVEGIAQRLGVTPGESYALVSTVAADLGNTVLFPSLAHGGCLHLLGREMVTDAPALGRYFEERRIDYLKIVPSHLAALHLADGGLRILPRRTLIVGGEASRARWAAGLRAAAPGTALLNHYGPTETTVGVLTRRIEADDLPASLNVPLGRPLPGAQAYVLDAGLQPVPAGVAGELCIGGRGLARGYLGRGDLTAERFVPSPFGEPGARLYRTGDLARHLPDGEVEFLGRMDHQVKMRGFRVELGEIEAALCQHSGVGQAVALVREDQPGEKRLVAYVVGKGGRAPQAGELRGHLASRLPEHMVPAALVALESLPLTANGKLDRRALPAPEGVAPGRGEGSVAPRTEVERVLAGIWSEVLGVESVGVGDNFFELGGDSILCIQVIARVREAGYRLTLKQIFQHRTIAELARVAVTAGRRERSVAGQEVVTGPVALTPIQRWFFEQELPNPHHFNQAVLLALREPVDVAALEGAVRELVRHHDALRLRFERDGEGWRQRNEKEGGAGVFAHVDLSADGAWEKALEADAARAQESLHLTSGPLLRVVHYDLGPAGERLLLVVHHLAVDGLSWRILLEDLQRAYGQLREGRRAELPAKTTSFQEWARRLAEHAESSALLAEAEHWTAEARRGVARLPVDHPEGENAVGSARAVSVELDREETRRLLQDVPGVFRTQINDVLLAALAQALSRWTGQSRVLVELEGHGREELFEGLDLSRTVGWFTALSPVLLDVGGCTGPGDVLKAVKEQLRGIPNRGIGHGMLRYLRDDGLGRKVRGLPPAEIRFNYLGQLDQALPESGIFGAAEESSGASRGREGRRSYLLDVNGLVFQGCLRLDWTYSEAVHRRETVEALAGSFLRTLQGLIACSLAPDAGGATPSDFPLAVLDQAALDRCLGSARDVEDVYPLAPTQQGLLFHALYAPGSGVYFEQLSCRLQGGLDLPSFQHAWQTVVDRHATLRTAFLWDGLAEPLQVVRRNVELVWHEADLRGMDEAGQRAWIEEALRADRERGFNLGGAPLMRLALFRRGEGDVQFAWSYHHLVLDGWSSAAVVRELFAFYRAYERGEELRLEAPRPYRDYIGWLRRQDLGRAESFWREALRGFRTPTALLPERPVGDPAGLDAADGREEVWLSRRATERLEALARRQQVTLNTVLQGAWALLLSRSSGEDDVVFGATVSGRPPELAGVESMLGLFINTLPVRVRVEPGQPLPEYLARLQEQQVEARQYEHAPLVDVQGWSEVPRGAPLFASILVFENYPVDSSVREQAGPALGIDGVRKQGRTNYPLTLEVTPATELHWTLDWDGRRFEPAAIRRMAGHLRMLLEGMAAEPEARLLDLPTISEAERHQLLAEWNAVGTELPPACVHELLAEQAERTPDAVALAFGDARLSYRELDRRASRLARHLKGLGVGPEVRVGICAERSLELVVGLLGVLKAGGAYVPADPEYPRERVAFMLEDAGVQVVLTQRRLVADLPGVCERVVCLDEQWGAEEAAGGSVVGPDNLAYVIYTSGSTGRPKGVQISHRSLVNFVLDMGRRLEIGREDTLVSVTSLSFDIFGLELFVPLACGAEVRLATREATRDGALLARTLEEAEATVLQSTPATWRMLLAAGWSGRRHLNLLCGGEALAGELAGRLLAMPESGRGLWNLFGPTETTIWSSVHRVETVREPIPIGRPIANTGLYVLDGHLQPAPVGVPGELSIGGDGLARGYLHRGDLTAERFVPHPFAGSGARLYRTGDLARSLPDGTVEFLGRIDHQVKVRGFRIELGEIEAVLDQLPGVEQAVVVAREDRPGDKRLVAYVTGRGGGAPGAGALRAHLAAKLPEHMLPSAFVALERMPLTPNGKVDRRALPAPDGARPDLAQAWSESRGPVEEVLAGIWAEVLGLARVGIHDNFFELGGHSLIATRLLGRVRDMLAVELPLAAVFARPTVAGLAEEVDAGMRAGRGMAYPPLTRRPRPEGLPLSFAQQRLWFLEQLEPGRAAYNQLAGVELIGPLDVRTLERSLGEVVRRHEVLRTTFEMADGSPVQVIRAAQVAALPVVDLASLGEAGREAEVRRRAGEVTEEPFDLRRGPLLRARVLRLGAEEHIVLLAMHHIVSDGWSMGVLIREISVLYEAFSQGHPSPLPELPVQYADYAGWQREWLRGEVLEGQVSYWKGRLAGLAPIPRLPADRARTQVQTYRGAVEPFEVPAGVVEALRRLSRREGVTLYMTLLGGFQVLLGRYAGEEDVATGSPIAGRTQSALEGLIGFFLNTLVMRTGLSGDPSARELLRRIREVTLGAYAHQDVPFEKLVDELQPERSLSYHPLFQVMFVLQNTPREELTLRDLRIRPLEGGGAVAKFDLSLSMYEEGERLHGSLEYSTDLFDGATIRRTIGHLGTLLAGMAADASSRPMALPLLGEDERRQVLVEWNATAADLPPKCVHELFEDQAELRPHAPAVAFEDGWLSYGELDRHANQLARHLRRIGIGPEARVGVCAERSLEMVVGFLGVLKAGAAYVPLDPEYPRERVAYMLEDAGVQVLLTQQRLLAGLPAIGGTIVCLDRDRVAIAAEAGDRPELRVDPGSLAYVIYTSGSTGKPKGVQIPHRSLTNFVVDMGRRLEIGGADRLLSVTSLSFDIFGLELFVPLACGAEVRLASREATLDGALLARTLEESTVLQSTPATWRMLLAAGWSGRRGLKLLCGGEALAGELAERLLALPERGQGLWNLFGPTETTIWSAVHPVEAAHEPMPIGHPIANTQLYVLDRHLEPVPVRVPGELYIGGDGLARGYLHRGDLTAERFVPHPFSGQGERLYRTGDLVRSLPDGTVEFLGRIDHQVKMRGFRIELGEIEAVLGRHPGVEQAVVAAREDRPGDKRLVAYVVPDRRGGADAEDPSGQTAQVSDWQGIWDETYVDTTEAEDPAFDIRGWISSYTGQPIPPDEMRDWVDQAVERVLAKRPARVLEIGCGTGLLLFRIAPRCAEYWATDFSARAIRRLHAHVDRPGSGLSHVRLFERPADDFSGVEEGTFDLVILNSVIQYFPGAPYLVRILEGAVKAVREGGCVFVGDVRSLPLLDAFHTSVQLHRAGPSVTGPQLRRRVERAKAQEKELLLDPAFFEALRRRLPRIAGVEIGLKRDRYQNELTRFRYDATLLAGPERPGEPAAPEAWSDYANDPRRGVLERQFVPRLRAAVHTALPSYMAPSAFVVMDALPMTPNGKVDRRALPAPDLERPELAPGFEAPRTPVEQILAGIWSETLGLDRVGLRDNFFELGGDSFQIMKVVARAGNRGLPIAPRMLFRYQTIAELADGIYDDQESRSDSLLVPFSAAGPGLPFFCVHPAGGRVQFFWSLGRQVGVDRLFYGVRASDGGPAGRRVEDIAALYVAEIRTAQPHGPYCLGGYSIGVFLAFEMARQLTAAGETVALLALLDSAVYRPAEDDPYAVRHLIGLAAQHGGVALAEEDLRPVEASRLMEHVLGEIARRSIAPADVIDAIRAVAPVGYANKLAVDEYMSRAVAAPGVYRYPGRITVFRAADEAAGEPGAATPLGWSARSEPDMGWGRLCSGEVEVHTVPGDHASILEEPQVTALSAALRACLLRAEEVENA